MVFTTHEVMQHFAHNPQAGGIEENAREVNLQYNT
jgi:hypothetical protein